MADKHGGDVLARALREEGVDTVFTLCGNHTLKAYQGLHDAGIALVDARTEAGAVMAADAYARATRRPAVALVTGGPGHTNALTGLITAHACDSPVVLLSGQVDLDLRGRGAQQEIDQVGSAAPLCKWVREVEDVNQLAPLVHEAFSQAMSGTTGAVHLSVPSDVLAAVPEDPARHRPAERAAAEPDPALVKRVTETLAAALRPVVIAGTGAYMAHCEEALERLLSVSKLPLFTVDQARGVVADGVPGVLGYADPSLNRVAREIHRADVVLLIGKRLDFRLRFGDPSVIAADATLIDVHAVGAEPDGNREREMSIATDVGAFVARLADEAGAHAWDDAWRAELAALPRLPDDFEEPPDDDGLTEPFHPLSVSRAIRDALPDDAALVLDGGDFVQWCRSDLPALGPGRWLRLGPMSTCGAGTPLAMGLKRAVPDRPVVLITGDGSFGYYLIEFEAAARQGLPFVAIVGHNSSWGLENNLQRGLYGEEYTLASELSATRFDRVITALGGYGERVTSLKDFGPALRRALDSGLPACLEVPVRRTPSPLTEAVIARGGEV